MSNNQHIKSEDVQNNVQMFRKSYIDILSKCIEIRKEAGFTQQFMSDWLNVDRRKIIELEKGIMQVGLLLNYADKLSINVKLNFEVL
jgi:DNA-binding XRE family transcriptional regulator